MKTVMSSKEKVEKRAKRASRIKASIVNPRNPLPHLIVFRSNRNIFASIFDPDSNKILASSSDITLKEKGDKKARAEKVGEDLAKKAKTLKITHVVFDRNGYTYHGRIKSLADGARKAGLKF